MAVGDALPDDDENVIDDSARRPLYGQDSDRQAVDIAIDVLKEEKEEVNISCPKIQPVVCSFVQYHRSHSEQKEDSEEPDTIVFSDKALSEDVEHANENVFE